MLQFLTVALAAYALAAPLERRAPAVVPAFVTQYAPIVYLHSQDPYRPSDIGSQLANTVLDVYLTSKADITGKTSNAVSSAIVINDHGNGNVDAFYFYLYASDYGGTYLGVTIGDHVGDWEHNMVRFSNGRPVSMWYSQHSNGEAFTYSATSKYNSGVRPVVYSANGTHANYAISGDHDHTIPNVDLPAGPIEDHTDKGPIWDPTLSAYYYKYDASSQSFSAYDSSTPVN